MANSFADFNRNLINDLRANRGQAPGGPFKGSDLVILTTRGAKSGEPRENPLVYTKDGDKIVVIASKGGSPSHPSWFHNLRAHPEVTIELGGKRFKARAHVADGEEYERLYRQQADIYPVFDEYRTKTTRKIPVVVLEKLSTA